MMQQKKRNKSTQHAFVPKSSVKFRKVPQKWLNNHISDMLKLLNGGFIYFHRLIA